MIKNVLQWSTLVLVTTSMGLAGNRSGSVSGQFLKLPVDARANALGGAGVALAEGPVSVVSNPAGILNVSNIAVGGSYTQWFADITHAAYGVTVNLHEWGSIGAGLIMLTTDDMEVRTPGSPEGTGELFKATEYAFSVGYSRQISEQFGLGVSAKYIDSHLLNNVHSATAIAFDVGTLYDIPVLRTRLGISLNNLGKDLTYITEQYSLPTALRFGARTIVFEEDIHRVYAAFQIGRPNDADEQYNLGVEYSYQDLVSLRTGYRFNYDTETWSGGIGVNLVSLGINGTVDYAYTNYKYLSGTHMFSLEVGL